MAKVTITIEDGNKGKFSIVSNPSGREMEALRQANEATHAHRAAMITLVMLRRLLKTPRPKKFFMPGSGNN